MVVVVVGFVVVVLVDEVVLVVLVVVVVVWVVVVVVDVVVLVDVDVVVVVWVVVVVVEVDVVVVVELVVVLVVVVEVVLVVVVVVGTMIDTRQPIGVDGVMGFEFVSKRLLIVRPTLAEPVVATVLNMTRATLTTPVGLVRLELWNAEILVEPLVNVPEFVVGLLENSAVLPPITEAIVTTVGSYVSVIVYAPSGVVPTSKRTSAVNWLPGAEDAGHESVSVAASALADATRIRMKAAMNVKRRSTRRSV